MKVIIAGSRGITNIQSVIDALVNADIQVHEVSEIVSGGANGVDTLGEELAEMHCIDIIKFPAEWDKYGKSAGYKRNYIMGKYADNLVAVWDGKSKGTKHMIDIMDKFDKPYHIEIVGV